ncbi:MAG: U32 family peptidase [Prevotellaceae bacterium]|jgi:putative protease|nr:U32 family peptidase [Prevotellaceae bacterium]
MNKTENKILVLPNREKTLEDFEIMAPTGNFECLMAAIQGGANSVYFGIENLNMRSKSANNFKLEQLAEIAEICKTNNVKSYLTLNVIMYDNDLEDMRKIVREVKRTGINAVIASDQSAIAYSHEHGVEVHISTQLNISNIESLKFYARYADVIVLARELNLEQVAEIHKQIYEQQIKGPGGNLVKIEMFAHGALCMSVSGKCYLSLHEYNYSANRGKCLQTCRRAYTVTDKETGAQLDIDNEYIMSPKDLCTIGFIDKMIDAGVSVFKIEGRARSAEYVKTVCRCYSEAIKSIADGTYGKQKIDEWTMRLGNVFNRGFWDGYYLGQRLGEWSKKYGNQSPKRKEYTAKCTNFFGNIGVAEFLIEAGELNLGDEVLITGSTTGVVEQTIKEIRVDLQSVEKAEKGVYCSIATAEKIRRGDRLYKVVSNKL